MSDATEQKTPKTALEKHIEKALAAVELLPISDELSEAKKKKFAAMNKRLLDAARKRAVAEFREQELRQKAETAKARAAAQNETAAKRRRREHLIFTIGAAYLDFAKSHPGANRAMYCDLLRMQKTKAVFNRVKNEILEFVPSIADDINPISFQPPQKKEAKE